MKILLIEDDEEKIRKISNFLRSDIDDKVDIICTKSYNSSLVELSKYNEYKFVLMDMSMPIYDIYDGYEDEDSETFAGRELLEQMKFRKIYYPTIIITQYDTFGEQLDKLSLDELKSNLEEKFKPNYRSTVYYNSSENDWKIQLKKEIFKITNSIGD